MSETKQIPTVTEVTVQNSVLKIHTYYNESFAEFLAFFIVGIVGGMQGNVRIVQAVGFVSRSGYPMCSGIVQGNLSRILKSKQPY